MAHSKSQYANTSMPDAPAHSSQQSSQPSLPPINFSENAANVSRIGGVPGAVTFQTAAATAQAQAQAAMNAGSASINGGRKQEWKRYLDILLAARQVAREAPQIYTQRLEMLYSVRDTLPQDEGVARNHQEERLKIEADIQNIDISYQNIMQHSSEEVKNTLMTIKESTISAMRRQLEENDKLREKYRAARENKTEIAIIRQQKGRWKSLVPGLIKELQGFQVFLDQESDV
jgi:hypothetical protein